MEQKSMSTPLLSIITVNFNNKPGLIKTLNSIRNQQYNSLEHIIIDANSTDGSIQIIQQYEKEATYPLYWISESDNGIYDGMNKGIKKAHGDYLYFLNSGDILIENTVLQKLSFDGSKYIYGNIKYVSSSECYRDIIPAETLDIIYLLKTALPHQACFIHHSQFKQRLYDTEYKIISDWIHTMECVIFEGCNYKHMNITIAEVDGSGISSNQEILMEERIKWIKSKFPLAVLNALSELYEYRCSELSSLIPVMSQTKRIRKTIKKILLILLNINNRFVHSERKGKTTSEIWDPF